MWELGRSTRPQSGSRRPVVQVGNNTTNTTASQTPLARKARLSSEHLSRVEAGRYDPSVGVEQRLAKALGVSLMELLG